MRPSASLTCSISPARAPATLRKGRPSGPSTITKPFLSRFAGQTGLHQCQPCPSSILQPQGKIVQTGLKGCENIDEPIGKGRRRLDGIIGDHITQMHILVVTYCRQHRKFAQGNGPTQFIFIEAGKIQFAASTPEHQHRIETFAATADFLQCRSHSSCRFRSLHRR